MPPSPQATPGHLAAFICDASRRPRINPTTKSTIAHGPSVRERCGSTNLGHVLRHYVRSEAMPAVQ
jgi:hypothetical protein